MTPEEAYAMVQMLMANSGTYGMIPPPVDRNGYPEPIEPSDIKAQNEALYRMSQTMTNPQIFGLFGGPMMDPSAFEPVIEEEVVDLPGLRALEAYRRATPGSIESLLAGHILDEGGTASTFTPMLKQLQGQLMGKVEAGEELTPEQQTTLSSLQDLTIRTEPEQFNPSSTIEVEDWSAIEKMANDAFQAYVSDPQYDRYDASGRPVIVKETPSELAQTFKEMGIALPVHAGGPQYTEYDFMPERSRAANEAQAQLRSLMNPLRDPEDPRSERLGFQGSQLRKLREARDEAARPIEAQRKMVTGAVAPSPSPSRFRYGGSLGDTISETLIEGQRESTNRNPITPEMRNNLSRAQNRYDAEKKKRNALRRKAYSDKATRDRAFARVAAHNARKEGRTPHQDQIREMQAMMRYWGVGY